MTIDFTNVVDFLKEKISRKQATAVVGMLVVMWTAQSPDLTNNWVKVLAMVLETGITFWAIWKHFQLEMKNPMHDMTLMNIPSVVEKDDKVIEKIVNDIQTNGPARQAMRVVQDDKDVGQEGQVEKNNE